MGPLRTIVREENENLLLLYVALLDGIRKDLFPEMMSAFREFRETREWSLIEEARKAGEKKAIDLRNTVISYWRDRADAAGLTTILRDYLGAKGR